MLTAYGYFGMWPSEIGRVDEVDFFYEQEEWQWCKSENSIQVV